MGKIISYWELEFRKTSQILEIIELATLVFGSREDAIRWLERPARGLNRQKPIEVSLTEEGLQTVSDYLDKIKYGVYC